MSDRVRDEAERAALELMEAHGDASSATRAAGQRVQTACDATDRGFWLTVQALLRERAAATSR